MSDLRLGSPGSGDIASHEWRRIRFLIPVVMPAVSLTFTVAAAVTGLPGWAWNLLAGPAIGLPAALLGTVAVARLGPLASRRFPEASALPVMAGIRWIVGVVTLTIAVQLLGPTLVREGVWWPWVPTWIPRISAGVGLLGVTFIAVYDRIYYRLQESYRDLERRRSLERFLPREAVRRVMAGDSLELAGERRTVTVLFADLRDSTAIAETMSGPEVVAFLNSYVGSMATAVFSEGGMIDKFLGDGLMAVFGVLPDSSQGAAPAARAALRIRACLADLNQLRESESLPPVHHGVGIHTGEVVLGAVGIAERSDYTAVGDTVNTASRLEALTKQYPRLEVDTLLTATTVALLPDGEFATRSLGTVEIRGRAGAIEAFTLG